MSRLAAGLCAPTPPPPRLLRTIKYSPADTALSPQDTYECIAETCIGGIVLTDRGTGRRYQAGVIDGGLRVNSAMFPIAVSASFGATSKYYVLEQIRDPHHLMREQRQRAERKANKPAKGRLSISSVKRRAEAQSRRALLEYCLPAEVRAPHSSLLPRSCPHANLIYPRAAGA